MIAPVSNTNELFAGLTRFTNGEPKRAVLPDMDKYVVDDELLDLPAKLLSREDIVLQGVNKNLAGYGLPPVNSMEEYMQRPGLCLEADKTGLAKPFTATTSSGLDVMVEHTWLYPEGEEQTYLNAQSGYTVTLSRNGEILQTYTGAGDVRITEQTDGTFDISPLADGETTLQGTERDDVILSWNAAVVRAGNGNDTVLAFGSGSYHMGGGNDSVFLNPFFITPENAYIDLGSGDNVLTGGTLRSTTIVGGNGNNTISASVVFSSSVTLGNGKNIVSLDNMLDNSSVTAGNGGNIIHAPVFQNGSSIKTGDGDDTVMAGVSAGHDRFVNLGGGKNTRSYDIDNFERMNAGLLAKRKDIPEQISSRFLA